MLTRNLKSETTATPVKETEVRETSPAARGYHTPELHVVGKAGELVQGSFGYTSSDLQYYRN